MGRKRVFIDNAVFTKLFNLVESGYSIEESCLKLKMNRNKFYRNATEEQKNILKKVKSTQRTVYSLSWDTENK